MQTMSADPGILCFHHCNVKVFCFQLPDICPQCKTKLLPFPNDDSDGIDGRLLPFRLPYPFIRASQYPCAIVLRPTIGDFLNDYNNTTDLHIAVTTSNGCIVEFDRQGLRRHRTDRLGEWGQCLFVNDVPEAWYDYWDEVLIQICQESEKWTVSNYHETNNNCYTFVLAFLQALGYGKLSQAAASKTKFCETYIVPRTTTAGKYISLYRKLLEAGIYVHHTHRLSIPNQPQQANKAGKPHYNHSYTSTTKIITSISNDNNNNNNNNDCCSNRVRNKTATITLPTTAGNYLTKETIHSLITRPHTTLCTIEE